MASNHSSRLKEVKAVVKVLSSFGESVWTSMCLRVFCGCSSLSVKNFHYNAQARTTRPHEQALADSGKDKLPFNRKKVELSI